MMVKTKVSSGIHVLALFFLSLTLACSSPDSAGDSGAGSTDSATTEAPAEQADASARVGDETESDEPAVEASADEPSEDGPSEGEGEADIKTEKPVVVMTTTMGTIHIELYPDEAPKSVENFLQYVRDGFYDGTIFHRVVPGFVIQGGGFTPDMTEKQTRPPIQNEANNGVLNLRGTICMARTMDPHSATSQFFINTKDNPPLDFREESLQGWGYAVFGIVTVGLDVVDAIEKVDRTRKGPHDDVPVSSVVIETARVAE